MIRVSFWGSPEISARLLEQFVKNPEFQVEFVVTQEDKPRSYRGREDEPTPVKRKADQYNIPVFTPKSLKKNSEDLYSQINQFEVDVNIVFAYGKIIPIKFFSAPKMGSLNFHASLLPQLRGASPIEHALLSGLDRTGWTMQKMEEELDAGDIYYTHEVEVKWEDDFSTLMDRLMNELLSFSTQVVKQYVQSELKPFPQSHGDATHCGKVESNMGKISWFNSAFKIRNVARAMSSRGGIYSYYNEKKYKLFPDLSVERDTILQSSQFTQKPGIISLITDQYIWVSCDDEKSLPFEFIQPEGKKKLTAREFVNGYRVQVGNRFETFSG